MAAVLTHSMGDIDKISFFLEECKRMGLTVLGPDLNESSATFDVNKKGQIRFGLGAIKGTGEAAVESIIQEREARGLFKSIWDFAERINLRTVNKKTFESLAYSGAFDCFPDIHRAQYFHTLEGEVSGIEKIIRYGNTAQSEKLSLQTSLFGTGREGVVAKPKLPPCEPWTDLVKLKFEKEVVGFYLSGHPLDPFKDDIKNFCTCAVTEVGNFKGKEIKIAGIVVNVNNRVGKNGKPFGIFVIEDYQGSLEFALFGEDYLKYSYMLSIGQFLFLKGKVQERYGQIGAWEFRPTQIQLLADLREKMVRQLELRINVQQISADMLSALHKAVQEHTGNCELRVTILDPLQNMNVESTSRKYKINPGNDFLQKLKALNLEYRMIG
jgi:DNA polymerase-3 subunit alpha